MWLLISDSAFDFCCTDEFMTKNCRLRRYITLHTAYSALVQLSATEALLVWERGPMASRCFPAYPNCSKL